MVPKIPILETLLLLPAIFAVSSVEACAGAPRVRVPAGSLQLALDRYSRQSGRQVIYRIEDVRDLKTQGVRGDEKDVLAGILRGTGLVARRDAGGALAIVRIHHRSRHAPTMARQH